MHRLALSGLICCLLGCAAIQSGAAAQSPTPAPQGVPHLDPNGVDVVQGTLNFPETLLSIGPSGRGGLSASINAPLYPTRDNYSGALNSPDGGNAFRVWVGSTGDYFTSAGQPSSYGTGATLTAPTSGTIYTYTTMDGTQYLFDSSLLTSTGGMGIVGNYGLLTKVIAPTGDTITITWKQYVITETGGTTLTAYGYRKQSVQSNSGYQLIYKYLADTVAGNDTSTPDFTSWDTLTKITAINTAVTYYDPTADGSGFSGTQPDGTLWPSVSFAEVDNGASSYLTQTDANNSVWKFFFNNSVRQITGIQRPNNSAQTISIGYDSTNTCVTSYTTSDGISPSNTWTYNSSCPTGSLTVTLPGGSAQWTYASNTSLYQVTSVTDPLGHPTTYSYYPASSSTGAGMLQTVTHPESDSETYGYDALNNVNLITRTPKPGTTSLNSGQTTIVTSATYPTSCSGTTALYCHKPLTTTDAKGQVTTYSYDSNSGGIKSVTSPAQQNGIQAQVRYTYTQVTPGVLNGSGTLGAATTNPSVWRLSTQSQCAQSAATGSSPACSGGASDETRTTIAYPAAGTAGNGLPISATTAAGTTGSVGAVISMTYTNDGDALTSSDPLSHITRYHYDAMRRLVGTVLPLDVTTGGHYRAVKTTYNADGTVQMVQQGTVPSQADSSWPSFSALQQEAFLYDGLGRKIQASAAGTGSPLALSQFSYDNWGRLQCQAVRMNTAAFSSLPTSACTLGTTGSLGADRITEFTYDNDNHTLSVIAGLNVSPITVSSSTYTADGMVQTVADGKGNTTTYQYDGYNRVYGVQWPATHTGTVSSATLNRSYSFDNYGRILTASANGQTITDTYDALGNLTQEIQPAGTVQYAYDLAGNRTGITWPDSFSLTYGYDNTNNLTSINQSAVALVGLAYDSLGRRQTMNRGASGAFTTTNYTYDDISRLASLSFTLPSTTTYNQTYNFTYNPANQIATRTSSNQTASYAYNGFASKNLSYGSANALNQITSTTPVSGGTATSLTYDGRGNLGAAGTVTYGYDAANNLTSVSSPAATLSYDPADRLYQISASSTSKFLYDGTHVIAEYQGSTLVGRYFYGPGADEPLGYYSASTSTTPSWLVADQRGSIVAVVNYAGSAVSGTNIYDEYGSPASANVGRFQYTGQMWLSEVGLYHYKARTYSPALGRFLQADPAGYSAGMNLYAYVGGDPINMIDPTGLWCVSGGSGDSFYTTCGPDDPVELPSGGNGSGNGEKGDTKNPKAPLTPPKPANPPSSPCDSAGSAPPPSRYSSLGQIVQGMANAHDPYGMGSAAAAIFDATNLLGFRRGGPLDAQVLYGGSPAYANYVYGVYNSAAGTSLPGTLGLANSYGNLFSNYPASVVMDQKYSSIPKSNVDNITNGYDDQTNGSTCHK